MLEHAINGPYDEPVSHWRYECESRTFSQESGRRPAGYVVATSGSSSSMTRAIAITSVLPEPVAILAQSREKGPPLPGTIEALALAWGVSKLPFVPDIIRAASHQ